MARSTKQMTSERKKKATAVTIDDTRSTARSLLVKHSFILGEPLAGFPDRYGALGEVNTVSSGGPAAAPEDAEQTRRAAAAGPPHREGLRYWPGRRSKLRSLVAAEIADRISK